MTRVHAVATKKAVPSTAPSRATTIPPNPLQRMFGTYLRTQRNLLSLSTGYVAGKMGLAETYYRLLEAGRASFNQGLSFKLLELLASHSARSGVPGAQLHFHRLALYLVGAQFVGVEMAAMVEHGEADRCDLRAMEELARHDADFERFHNETKDYYTFAGHPEGQRQFLEDIACPSVGMFLTSSVYLYSDDTDIVQEVLPAKALLELPTLNIEMVTRLVVDLTGRPFVHTPPLAAAWENRSSRQIRAVHGIYRSSDFVVSESNLSSFLYSYLEEKNFNDIRFVFLKSTHESSDSLRFSFIKNLNKSREKNYLQPINEKLYDKIKFIIISENNVPENCGVENILQLSDGERSGSYDAYWSFEMETGIPSGSNNIPISFLGKDFRKSSDIWNLNLFESWQRKKDFDYTWNCLVKS